MPRENTEAPARRDLDLLGAANSRIRLRLDELCDAIDRGWSDQGKRSDNQEDWWNIYNCVLDGNQFFTGNSQLYVPIVRDAITARATRFVNQLFPNAGRYVDVVSHDGKQPMDIIALVENYIRNNKLKTKIARPLSVNGDIEGQYNLYVDWSEIRRWMVTRIQRQPLIDDGIEPVQDPDGEPIDDIKEEEIVEGGPGIEVLHDSDVLVMPQTADSIDEALESGGCVVICRRWTKADIEKRIDDGEIRQAEGKALIDLIKAGPGVPKTVDQEKKLNEAIGIRSKGGPATVWEVWLKLPLADKGYDEKGGVRLCRVYIGPERRPLGAVRNPYWNDRCPLISEPVFKIAGRFKGQSLVEVVAPLQWAANDAANEGEDSAHYSAMPIMRVSPNVTQPIILNVGAKLRADPGEIEMIAFPDLTPRQIQRIMSYSTQIFETMGVNPAMLPQQSGRPKRNQAEIAMEQQVDLLTTSDAVTVMEEGIFTPLCRWMVDLDHQFRDWDLTVQMFGVMGKRAQMQDIPPQQNAARYFFKWLGAEAARNAAMMQQQIGALNVMKQMQPQLMAEGYRLRLAPIIENMAVSIFGAATGSHVIEDMRHQSSLDPQMENGLLADGHEVPVQPLDPDVEHLKSHIEDARQNGDPFGAKKLHISGHLAQMQQKAAAQAQMAMNQMMQGGGGGGGGRPGPREGAVPAGPRLVAQQPPGAIRPDNMPGAGALTMPRRM